MANVGVRRILQSVSPARAGMDRRTMTSGSATLAGGFPPHARGWTRGRHLERPIGRPRFPRTRGDGPSLRNEPIVYGEVSSFPRTRGDGPVWLGTTTEDQAFPPHARGWTAGRVRNAAIAMVSPARAGMDLFGDSSKTFFLCFPRTRGDGPPKLRISQRQIVFPRTRGDGPYRAG